LYRAAGLKKVHGTKTVLNIPVLEVEKGRIVALLGPNGAGKTTLVHILGFLDVPSDGTLLYRNRPVAWSESRLQSLRREAVVVGQHPILFTTTVYRNLEFGLKVRRVPEKERRRITEATLDLVGMKAFAKSPAHHLSGGETQRVALARALAVSPQVLLCDEPTSSVDLENRAAIIHILKRINEEQKITVIFTTHDRFEAASLAQDTFYLEHGTLTNSPQDNVFSARLYREGDGPTHCVLQETVRLLVPTERVGRARVGIEPGRIDILEAGQVSGGPNRLDARVVQVMEERRRIRLVVDAGVWFTVLMSRQEYLERRIMVGESVTLVVPPESIHLFGEPA